MPSWRIAVQFGDQCSSGPWRRHFTHQDTLVANLVPVEFAVLAAFLADDRSIQRNPRENPRVLEYDRISACNRMSVSAAPVRPTGPAAADASPPIVNLSVASFSIPRRFITSMITSVDSPPIWAPKLPPPNLIAAGPPTARRGGRGRIRDRTPRQR